MRDRLSITGQIRWRLTRHGVLVRAGSVENLVTRVGDQMYAERGAGVAGALAVPLGMKLGTGGTAPAKTGSGAALASYLTDSDQEFDDDFPASALSGDSRRVSYQCVWAEGKATTASPITEVVIVNEALADATSNASATVARGLAAIGTKAADVVLTVAWTHDMLGS